MNDLKEAIPKCEQCESIKKLYLSLEKENQELKDKVEKLTKCAEFYADWENECCGDYMPPNKARRTLKEIKEGEE